MSELQEGIKVLIQMVVGFTVAHYFFKWMYATFPYIKLDVTYYFVCIFICFTLIDVVNVLLGFYPYDIGTFLYSLMGSLLIAAITTYSIDDDF